MSIITAEVPGFFRQFSDGSVERFPIPTSPPSPEFSNGYKSKDIVIDATKPITARIFLPDTEDRSHPLRVLVYFHGGGFCMGSTTWSGYHDYLAGLCVESKVLIVSVDYRLAPEHKIPVPYQDCYASLQWLAGNVSVEPWLERADLSRVFLSGESAGANIVHHVMIRIVEDPIRGMDIKGLMVVHPFFGSEERTESESADGVEKWVGLGDLFWKLSLPEGADRDHPACNFVKVEATRDWKLFPVVVVAVAGMDLLKERGIMYAEFLRGKGLEVEVVIAEGQQHAFHAFDPHSQAAHLLQTQMANFMNKH